MFCKNCGTEGTGGEFCKKCGVKLGESSPQSPVQSQPYSQQPTGYGGQYNSVHSSVPGYNLAQKKQSSGIAGLILGILSIITWLLPIAGVPVSIAGIIVSGVSKSHGADNKAIIGLVLAIIGLIASIINSIAGVMMMM